ncbi:transposase [Streptomyces sp. NPDC050523]|uniref:transposase n=1 Tax=Streptomyces sp. NPDC050523 TaxID=3365622 RepID=UPI0037AB0456
MTVTLNTWVMGEMQEIRTGRHCAFVMHVHSVFVTKFRHQVFTDAHLRRMEEIMRSVCTDFAVTKLVNSLKGVSSRRLRLGAPPGRWLGIRDAPRRNDMVRFTIGLKPDAVRMNYR